MKDTPLPPARRGASHGDTPNGGPPHDEETPVVELRGLTKDYGKGENITRVLKGIDLVIGRRDFAALIGPSGSGKSTLLNVLGLLDRPTGGVLRVNGIDAGAMPDDERTNLRGRSLGFVFQFHHLLPAFSALENVLMPIRVLRSLTAEDVRWGLQLLDEVGLRDKANRKATDLSGGQQQRVAVARALAMRPALVLADEPTGNLDSESSEQVFSLLRRAHETYGCAFLIVTHDPRIAQRCKRVVEIVDGAIRSDVQNADGPS